MGHIRGSIDILGRFQMKVGCYKGSWPNIGSIKKRQWSGDGGEGGEDAVI